MSSNPIQQRIEWLCGKWEESKLNRDARIIHIRCQPDETDMVDNFYYYMIGVNTEIIDIAFHFESVCVDVNTFSRALLDELKEIMHIWNNVQPATVKDYVPVQWAARSDLAVKDNHAALFVENFNNLARAMNLADGFFAVAIFRGRHTGKGLTYWFNDALKAGIDPAVKFLIHDTVAKPVFQDVSERNSERIETIKCDLEMPKAVEQAASMGDPNDPATAYRQSFIKMMNAMTAGQEQKADGYGRECIDMATQNLQKDPYWVIQIVVVYIALANDKIRYKNKLKTIEYANKAVETATAAKTYFGNEVASIIMAQALMFRGTVNYVNRQYAHALDDFLPCFELYKKQGNTPLAIEACRMAAESSFHGAPFENLATMLANGVRLGRNMDPLAAQGTTYAGLLDLLLQTRHEDDLQLAELNEIAIPIFGDNWITVVKSWRQPPNPISLQARNNTITAKQT